MDGRADRNGEVGDFGIEGLRLLCAGECDGEGCRGAHGAEGGEIRGSVVFQYLKGIGLRERAADGVENGKPDIVSEDDDDDDF